MISKGVSAVLQKVHDLVLELAEKAVDEKSSRHMNECAESWS